MKRGSVVNEVVAFCIKRGRIVSEVVVICVNRGHGKVLNGLYVCMWEEWGGGGRAKARARTGSKGNRYLGILLEICLNGGQGNHN